MAKYSIGIDGKLRTVKIEADGYTLVERKAVFYKQCKITKKYWRFGWKKKQIDVREALGIFYGVVFVKEDK